MAFIKGFSTNEYSFSNNSIYKLHDALSVIDFSLQLIEHKGRREFEAVIMQQLRLICTESNDLYEKSELIKKNISDEDNRFTLFDIIGDLEIISDQGEKKLLKDAKIFPEIKLEYRDYTQRINSNSKYFFFTGNSVVQRNKYTFEEFLNQPYIEVEDAEGNKSYKSIKQCIKLLANKLQGAHYQVYIKKVQLDVIHRSNVIAQTLGKVTLDVLMPICVQILLDEDKQTGGNMNTEYMKRENYYGLDFYSATPLLD